MSCAPRSKSSCSVGMVALGGMEAYDRFVRTFLAFLEDPSSLTYSVLFLVEGVRGTD